MSFVEFHFNIWEDSSDSTIDSLYHIHMFLFFTSFLAQNVCLSSKSEAVILHWLPADLFSIEPLRLTELYLSAQSKPCSTFAGLPLLVILHTKRAGPAFDRKSGCF